MYTLHEYLIIKLHQERNEQLHQQAKVAEQSDSFRYGDHNWFSQAVTNAQVHHLEYGSNHAIDLNAKPGVKRSA